MAGRAAGRRSRESGPVRTFNAGVERMKIQGKSKGKPESRTPVIGILEWFRPGEHERVERVIEDLKTLGVAELRTGFSWADWHSQAGKDWYSWLFPRLSRAV